MMNPKFVDIVLFGYALFILGTVVNAEQKISVNATFERLMEQKSYWGIDHLFPQGEQIYQNVPTPEYKKRYDLISETNGNSQSTLKGGTMIANIPESVNEFIISAVVHPLWKMSWYANIFTFMTKHQHWGGYGTRNPGLWFYPNSFSLSLWQGLVKNGSENYVFLTSHEPLQRNKDNWVVIEVVQDKMTLYVNGKENGHIVVPLSNRPELENLKVWASDSFHQAAGVILKDFKYYVLTSQDKGHREHIRPEPTPEPSPQPTPKPSPQPTPEPSPQPTSEQTLQPTPKPSPQPTPEPSPQPTSEQTLQPTPYLSPQPTPYLSAQPTSEQTLQPTPKPSPQPTPEPLSPDKTESGDHVWGVNLNDNIYYRNGVNGSWKKIDGGLKHVSVSADGDHIWGVNSNDHIHYRNGVNGFWKQIAGSLKQVSVSGNGDHIWGVNSNDHIYYRNGVSGSWKKIEGSLKYVSVSADGDHVWGVNLNDYIYYRNGVNGSWKKIDGLLKQIAVSANGDHIWGVNSKDQIFYRNGVNGSWKGIAGSLKHISVSADGDHVWGVNLKDHIYYRNGVNSSWKRIAGGLKQVSVGGNGKVPVHPETTPKPIPKPTPEPLSPDKTKSGDHEWGVNLNDNINYRNGVNCKFMIPIDVPRG